MGRIENILKTVNQAITSPFRAIADRFIDEDKNPEMRERVDLFIDASVSPLPSLIQMYPIVGRNLSRWFA